MEDRSEAEDRAAHSYRRRLESENLNSQQKKHGTTGQIAKQSPKRTEVRKNQTASGTHEEARKARDKRAIKPTTR